MNQAVRHCGGLMAALATVLVALPGATVLTSPAAAQTITVVGTPHLTGLEEPPSAEQLAHTVEALSAFEPTQVCVEAMSGERIEALSAHPERHGGLLQRFAGRTVLAGQEQQRILERRPAQAREEAGELAARWDELNTADRARTIALQLAGFEFPSAVLNWSRLDEEDREEAGETLRSPRAVEFLNAALESVNEIYSLGVSLARRAGLHEMCAADSMEDEIRGVRAGLEHGGQAILEAPEVRARVDELMERSAAAWRPEDGPEALTRMLRFYNSEEWAEMDRDLQWETLHMFDNEEGAFQRRLMYWHARTAEISAELFRALARGPEERVLFIVGSAHRPFTEADLRAQPWFKVEPAEPLLKVLP